MRVLVHQKRIILMKVVEKIKNNKRNIKLSKDSRLFMSRITLVNNQCLSMMGIMIAKKVSILMSSQNYNS